MNTGELSIRERLAARTEIVLRARSGHLRQYEVTFMRPGGFVMEPYQVWKSRFRKKAMAAVLFRKCFGSAPDTVWQYRNSAGAKDKRGNSVMVDQLNNFARFPVERGLLLPEKCGVAA